MGGGLLGGWTFGLGDCLGGFADQVFRRPPDFDAKTYAQEASASPVARKLCACGYFSNPSWPFFGFPDLNATGLAKVYCRASGFVILKELEVEGHQAGEFFLEGPDRSSRHLSMAPQKAPKSA
jgi:hypothetical protein